MTVDGLKREAKRLVSLLEDPQTGLFTWHQLVNETIHNITNTFKSIFSIFLIP